MPKYQQIRPDSKSPCLCGSGLEYKVCCKKRLPGTKDIGKEWRKHASENRWLRAIKALRADVTQYTIWHLSHTARVIKMDPKFRQGRLMRVDIMALSDYVGLLMTAYRQYSYLHKAPDVLGRLMSNIDDPRWRKKIAYHKGLCALFRDDREGALQEISVLGKISADDDDVDVLQMYLDLHGSKMGLTESMAFMDQIIDLTTSDVDKLQYLGAKAFQLLLARDNDGARDGFESAIAFGKELELDNLLSPQAERWLCRALEGLGIINRDTSAFDEIVNRVRNILLAPQELTDLGRSEMHRMIADAQRQRGDYKEALTNYSTAHLYHANEIFLIFKAECALGMGEKKEALGLLKMVDIDKLAAAEQADHAFVYFFVAKALEDASLLMVARENLKSLRMPQPYFETQQLHHLVAAQDAIDALADNRALPDSGKALSWVELLTRYITIKPSLFGIGINVNNMIDDVDARADAIAKRLKLKKNKPKN